jgi:thiol-disulfide isomerase/thioredoxin
MFVRVPVCAMLCCGIVFAAQVVQGEQEPQPLPIGASAPDFSLPGVDGKTYTLADFKEAKVLVLIFTCNHCPTAQAYEGRIQAMAREYREKGVAVVAINPNDPAALRLDELGYTDLGDSFEEMKLRAEEKGFEFPYLDDGATQKVSQLYGPQSTPHVFIFDADRKLRYAGRIDDSEDEGKVRSQDARNAIDALLAGAAVPVETTKTMGCSTKWASKRPTVQAALDRWNSEPVRVEMADVEAVKGILKNDSKKLLLVNVWATWCGPCVVEFPELVTIYRMYRGRPFDMVTISANAADEQQYVREFLERHHASMRNVQFSGENTYDLVEAVDPEWRGPLPYTLLVKPGGEIVYRHTGAIDPLEVKRAIVGILGRTF